MEWPSPKWAPSRWTISRWLLLTRLLQVSCTLVTAVMNGFLLAYIHRNRLGVTTSMFCLEMMICIALIYSGLVLSIQHSGNQRRRSSTILATIFVAGDVLLTGIMIAIISVLSRTGLPTDCHGLTRDDMEKGDAPDNPPPEYDTRFGDGDDIKGLLDKYCSLEQSFYSIAIALVFTYMLTITLGALRIFEQRWNQRQKDRLFPSTDDIYQPDHLGPEIQSTNAERDPDDAVRSRERVLTPTARANPIIQTVNVESSSEIHGDRAFNDQRRTQPLPVSPVSIASRISQVSPISPVMHQHGLFHMASQDMPDMSAGNSMMSHSSDLAAEAMVIDGYRYTVQPRIPPLPAYSPSSSGGRFMDGHGNESNEMRLSDYVKGETRAQNMKDSGLGM
ncbi:uncharacterized protein F4812DRAFT_39545 [Daldinia caldariorum]|uniref:uncharacterized protein n=1 Tax=Daldinia caldariorum TaxID=326644 RepID=UPI0020076F1E|nr:uncharacterized protein F4812DRAFT_39545 [Daldinia caldariorum]KAI1473106.1 hypothetical protein F4812DRAFT_39545 [Daldinia caldariorum]